MEIQAILLIDDSKVASCYRSSYICNLAVMQLDRLDGELYWSVEALWWGQSWEEVNWAFKQYKKCPHYQTLPRLNKIYVREEMEYICVPYEEFPLGD